MNFFIPIYAPSVYFRNWHAAIQKAMHGIHRLGLWYSHLNSPFYNQVHVFKHGWWWSHMTLAI